MTHTPEEIEEKKNELERKISSLINTWESMVGPPIEKIKYHKPSTKPFGTLSPGYVRIKLRKPKW